MYKKMRRYVQTESGRIFNLDGDYPVLELIDGFWYEAKNYKDEKFTFAKRLSVGEVNKMALFSDYYIDPDNVDKVTTLMAVIYASALAKFNVVLSLMNLILTKKDPLSKSVAKKVVYGESQDMYQYIDCLCVSLTTFLGYKEFHIDDKDQDMLEYIIGEYLVGCVKKKFPNAEEIEPNLVTCLNNYFDEIMKAYGDKNRKEKMFTLMENFDEKDWSPWKRGYACFANRFLYRIMGNKEEDLIYSKEIKISSGLVFETYFHQYIPTLLEKIEEKDNQILEIAKKELL